MKSKTVTRTLFTSSMLASAALLSNCSREPQWNEDGNTNRPSATECWGCTYHNGYWYGSTSARGYTPVQRGGVGTSFWSGWSSSS